MAICSLQTHTILLLNLNPPPTHHVSRPRATAQALAADEAELLAMPNVAFNVSIALAPESGTEPVLWHPNEPLPPWFLARGAEERAAREPVRAQRGRMTLDDLKDWLADEHLTPQMLPSYFATAADPNQHHPPTGLQPVSAANHHSHEQVEQTPMTVDRMTEHAE